MTAAAATSPRPAGAVAPNRDAFATAVRYAGFLAAGAAAMLAVGFLDELTARFGLTRRPLHPVTHILAGGLTGPLGVAVALAVAWYVLDDLLARFQPPKRRRDVAPGASSLWMILAALVVAALAGFWLTDGPGMPGTAMGRRSPYAAMSLAVGLPLGASAVLALLARSRGGLWHAATLLPSAGALGAVVGQMDAIGRIVAIERGSPPAFWPGPAAVGGIAAAIALPAALLTAWEVRRHRTWAHMLGLLGYAWWALAFALARHGLSPLAWLVEWKRRPGGVETVGYIAAGLLFLAAVFVRLWVHERRRRWWRYMDGRDEPDDDMIEM